jgi:RNA polymerase sigma-70 factor (ECF subfamily)
MAFHVLQPIADARIRLMPNQPPPKDPDPPASADLAEFVRLLTEHQAVLRGYIRALIPSSSDVGDVLQNTNLALWERRKDFVPGSNFKAWAFTVARYRALEHRRILRRDHRLVFDDELLDLLAKTTETSLDFDRMDGKRLALSHCLKQLKERDRALIATRYSRGCTLEEYSLADGRSPGSLRVILNRLRTVLRRCVEERLAMEGNA